MSFLKRLFGFASRSAPATPAASAANSRAPAVSTVQAPPAPPPRTVVIAWQELIDRQSRIAGYVLRPSPLQPGAMVKPAEIVAALEGERIRQLAERRLAMIPVDAAQWIGADFRSQIGPQTLFLIDAATPAEALPLAADIRAAGARVAVSDTLFGDGAGWEGLADTVMLDVQGAALQAFEARIRNLRQRYPALRLIVDGVSSWAEHRLFQSHGVQLCLGSFAAVPEETDGQVSQSRLIVIEMLNLLRTQADLTEIAAVAKRDPAVVVKLLEMANSPLSGLSRQVVAIEDAIMLLGRDALYRWLALAMFRIGAQDGRDETLLVIALCRAYFLESLAGGDRAQAGELFLVGLLSVLDALLGVPMPRILEKMRLPDAVASVLLRSDGPYARYLSLAMAMERCRIAQALLLAESLGIPSAVLLSGYSEAMALATAELTGQ